VFLEPVQAQQALSTSPSHFRFRWVDNDMMVQPHKRPVRIVLLELLKKP
jgi:hypothetical protein